MPETFRIIYTRRAASDLAGISDYISRNSSENAAKMIERLLAAIESLATFPHRYRVVSNADQAGEAIRSMTVRPYLVRYHVDDARKAVTVLSLRHGAREPDL